MVETGTPKDGSNNYNNGYYELESQFSGFLEHLVVLVYV